MTRLSFASRLLLLPIVLSACGSDAPPRVTRDVPQRIATDLPGPLPGSVAAVRAELGLDDDEGGFEKAAGEISVVDLTGTRVASIEALAGLPITKLALTETQVTDLTPVVEMPLELLYAVATPIADLSPLAGKRINELNLMESSVSDLGPLADCQLGTLWLRECPIADLAPLTGTGLVSLDVQGTLVADLRPLAPMSTLRRLNIADTPVTDLTPLAELRLERLILTPSRIRNGLEELRQMGSLAAIDTSFDGEQPQAMPAAEFWRRYDAGEFADATTD